MKKRKICYIFIMLFIFGICDTIKAEDINWHIGNNYVYNGKTTPLTEINLMKRQETEFAILGSMQGACLAGDTIVSTFFRNDGEGNTTLELIDSNSFELKNSIDGLKLGHANDCTYNPNTGYVMFVDGNVIHQFKLNDDYTISDISDRTVDILSRLSSIAYDNDHDQYIIHYSNRIYIVDSNFTTIIKSFDASKNLIAQGISYWNNHIYFSCYEEGEYNEVTKETIYNSSERGSGIVFVYDMNGNLINILYIPKSKIMGNNTNYFDLSEIENIAFYDDGTMILGYNLYYNKDKTLNTGYYKKRVFYTSTDIINNPLLTQLTEKAIKSISISKLPKTTYVKNKDNLNLDGGTLKIVYSDDSYEEINLTDQYVSVTGFDNSEPGNKILIVSYNGYKTEFTIEIVDSVLVPNTGISNGFLIFGMLFIALGIGFLIYTSKKIKLNNQL